MTPPAETTVLTRRHHATARHTTAWLEAGPADGPLMVFVHGWPELGVVWRSQLAHFAAAGWRCVAPDMRGYGGSSVPTALAAYALRELVADLTELHDALGGAPAVWVGHDWGSPVVWALASHHARRCRAVASLCVPYLARGFAVENLLPLVDRDMYPMATHPAGQWDYCLHYRERFAQAAADFEADIASTLALLYRRALPDTGERPAMTASVRAKGGWFGTARRAKVVPRDASMLSEADFAELVAAFERTGFASTGAWYMNDDDNVAYAREAADFGRLRLPVLFVHAARDATCKTVGSRLAEPMRADCADLSEATIDGGHELMLERPAEVDAALDAWLAAKGLRPV